MNRASYNNTGLALPAKLAAMLAEHPQLAILTGAGVSAESGIPTFREAQHGLWAQFSPEELATPQAFAQNPQRVWDWYRWRRTLVQKAQPNAAHHSIAEMARQGRHCALVTQNVDGLLQRAGAVEVTELHGNLWRQRCAQNCGYIKTVDQPGSGALPQCPDCSALLRPDVVWFGEALPEKAMQDAVLAITEADVVIVAGTSNLVYPAAALPLQALEMGKTVVEVNPEQTPLSPRAHYFVAARASQTLPAIRDCWLGC